MITSLNPTKTSKLTQSIEKKSEGQIKKLKLGSSTTNVEKKLKPSKLDGSINYGRVPLTRSI